MSTHHRSRIAVAADRRRHRRGPLAAGFARPRRGVWASRRPGVLGLQHAPAGQSLSSRRHLRGAQRHHRDEALPLERQPEHQPRGPRAGAADADRRRPGARVPPLPDQRPRRAEHAEEQRDLQLRSSARSRRRSGQPRGQRIAHRGDDQSGQPRWRRDGRPGHRHGRRLRGAQRAGRHQPRTGHGDAAGTHRARSRSSPSAVSRSTSTTSACSDARRAVRRSCSAERPMPPAWDGPGQPTEGVSLDAPSTGRAESDANRTFDCGRSFTVNWKRSGRA